jgi:hypothetical protein
VRCGEEEVGVHFIGLGRQWGGGEAADGGGVLLLVGFEGVKGGKGDRMAPIQWGSECGMMALWFGSSCMEEVAVGGARHGGAAGGAAVPMEAGGWSRCTRPKGQVEWAGFGGSEGETKMGRAMKWAKSQGGCSINSFYFFLN